VGDLVFANELEEWATHPNVRVIRMVDPGGETPDWKGEVGFPPAILEKANISAKNAAALIIGPPIMIKLTLPVLAKLGLTEADIYTSLENRMKCGVGKCGRCNAGGVYICKEGPVFTLEQVKSMPNEY
jgi:sulfhydrogenase subunit gamma (sulfur reductase)